MRVELLPGMTNVVRFPVERRARPTLELLRGIAPDVREVLNLAEAFGMEMPVPDLRERVDAASRAHRKSGPRGRSGSPVAARPGGRATCVERPRSSSASRLAQPDLRQCSRADLGMANCRRPCRRSGCRDRGNSTQTGV
jgi:hypothetical protein